MIGVKSYDVIIIGGGPAGATAAFILQRSGLKCLVVDKLTLSGAYKVGESLLGSVKPILKEAGLTEWVQKSFPLDHVGNLSSWGSEKLVSKDFIFSPHGCGWHLNRALFDDSLRQAAAYAGAVFHKCYVHSVCYDGQHWIVDTKTEKFCADWIVDASGKKSVMSKHANIRRHKDYPLLCMYRYCDNTSRETRSLIESVSYGWWYTSPIPNGKRITALYIDPSKFSKKLYDTNYWNKILGDTIYIQGVCNANNIWTPLQGADASGQWQDTVCGPNWVAVGDAAITFDPISSQGIFNAIYTAWKASIMVINNFNKIISVVNGYQNLMVNVRTVYKNNVYNLYKSETRWNNYPFWNRFKLL